MEKQPHQEYRDELAQKLKEIRDAGPDSKDPKSENNRAKAEGYLEAKRETKKFEKAKYLHDEENSAINSDEILNNDSVKSLDKKLSKFYSKGKSNSIENFISLKYFLNSVDGLELQSSLPAGL